MSELLLSISNLAGRSVNFAIPNCREGYMHCCVADEQPLPGYHCGDLNIRRYENMCSWNSIVQYMVVPGRLCMLLRIYRFIRLVWPTSCLWVDHAVVRASMALVGCVGDVGSLYYWTG